MSCAKGFTLIEALLTAVLLLLLLTLLVEISLSAGRSGRRGAQQVALQQEGLLALSRLDQALASTPPAGVTRDGGILCLQRLSGVTALADQLWEPELTLFWVEGDRLLTRTVRDGALSVTAPARPRPRDYLTGGSVLIQDRVELSHDWSPPVLTVHLKLTGREVGTETLQLDRSYYLFNEQR